MSVHYAVVVAAAVVAVVVVVAVDADDAVDSSLLEPSQMPSEKRMIRSDGGLPRIYLKHPPFWMTSHSHAYLHHNKSLCH